MVFDAFIPLFIAQIHLRKHLKFSNDLRELWDVYCGGENDFAQALCCCLESQDKMRGEKKTFSFQHLVMQ